MKKNWLIAPFRFVALILWITVVPLLFIVLRLLKLPGYLALIPFFHAGTCRILGIQVEISGEMSASRPTLYVSNHVSYIDIFILGRLPAYFIAKSEVASWPWLGKLAKFQNTLFIERKPGKAKQHLEVMQQHLATGNSLTLFPEGTSTNGFAVLPFKSTLFGAASPVSSEYRVAIQPVTLAYTHYAGEPIDSHFVMDHYAWHSGMEFLPHLLGLMSLKKVSAKIHFHPVCYIEDFETRKVCADHCQARVAEKLESWVTDPSIDKS